MSALRRFAVGAALILAGFAQAAPGDGSAARVEPREQSRPTVEGLRKAAAPRARQGRRIELPRPGPEAQLQGSRRDGVPLKVGFSRDVAQLADAESAAAALTWETLADGARVASISITSPEAAAVRASLRIVRLPDSALLRFSGPGESTAFEVDGITVNAALGRDAESGAGNERAYWSPVIEGDTVTVEIELPAGSDPRDARFGVPRVSHLVTSAGTAFATPTTIGRSASCQRDAMCTSGWSNQMNAVAQMIFSDGSGSYLCTGTLLADADAGTNHPYFLTARHCISSQSLASSLTTYWFYRSSACNSGSPGPYQQLTGGGTLLYSASTTDTTFLRLANTPPQGTHYAGWYVGTTPPAGSDVTGLHQPRGDLLKNSQGRLAGYATCSAPTEGGFTCNSGTASSSTFYDIGWTVGITEPGSSGSALFLGNGYVVGQLYGGSSSCGGTGRDVYGRFDVAYNAGIKAWLSPPLQLTVTKGGSGSGTVSSSPAGISCGATCSAGFASGTSVTLAAAAATGSTFTGWTGACSGTGSCTVAMTSAKSVGAAFAPASATLSVSTSGSGTVTSSPSGIHCGSTCSASYAQGTSVTLTATPAAGGVFQGWSGHCSGKSSCLLSMTAARSVLASFGAQPGDLSISQAASPAAAQAGKDVVFRVTTTNNATTAASNVVVKSNLPAGSAFVWASPGCSLAAGKLTCAVGSMAAGAKAAVVIVVRPSSPGTLTHAVNVTATETDPLPADNAHSLDVPVTAPPTAKLVQRYRLYSPVTQEHHFTTDANEYAVLGTYKDTWVQEGPAGKVLDNPGSFNGVTAVPYYRLYDNATSWHHWTTDTNEYYTLAQYPGWSAEGVDGYILPAPTAGAVQLYRLNYSAIPTLHHWTIDVNEYNTLIASYGWFGEGGAGFVIE